MYQFGSVLSWEKVQGLKEDPNVIANFSFAPMTSMDCEEPLAPSKTSSQTRETVLQRPT